MLRRVATGVEKQQAAVEPQPVLQRVSRFRDEVPQVGELTADACLDEGFDDVAVRFGGVTAQPSAGACLSGRWRTRRRCCGGAARDRRLFGSGQTARRRRRPEQGLAHRVDQSRIQGRATCLHSRLMDVAGNDGKRLAEQGGEPLQQVDGPTAIPAVVGGPSDQVREHAYGVDLAQPTLERNRTLRCHS